METVALTGGKVGHVLVAHPRSDHGWDRSRPRACAATWFLPQPDGPTSTRNSPPRIFRSRSEDNRIAFEQFPDVVEAAFRSREAPAISWHDEFETRNQTVWMSDSSLASSPPPLCVPTSPSIVPVPPRVHSTRPPFRATVTQLNSMSITTINRHYIARSWSKPSAATVLSSA